MLAEFATVAVLWAIPPAPSPLPVVHENRGCPSAAGDVLQSCYLPATNEILQAFPGNRPVLEHEYGHAYDRLHLSDGERIHIARAMGWGAWHEERFADFYGGCRLAASPDDPHSAFQYRPFRSLTRIAARCRLIARAGL